MGEDLRVVGSGAEPAIGTVFVDTSDLLMYLHHHSVVSGIQRVIVEVLPGLMRRHDVEFVAFSEATRRFVQLDRDRVAELIRRVQHSTDATKGTIQVSVDALQATVGEAPEARGGPGDVLAVLGAAWVYEGFFRGVLAMREQGVAVAVLLYDLIPVVSPGIPESFTNAFRQYLPRVAFLADRAPGISAATRRDFETYCEVRGWEAPPGGVTTLAADQWHPQDDEHRREIHEHDAWPRPFVLFVATIEIRKNHILALRAWQQLGAKHGFEKLPDLVCVGRLGWNAFEFLEEYAATNGLNGKVWLLTEQVSDQHLAALYRDCVFTVYPSRYEGWGLPVTESLMSGKPCVVARNTSLPEAGGQFATYFEDNNIASFVDALEKLLDPEARNAQVALIRESFRAPRWDEVSEIVSAELKAAVAQRREFRPDLELGREYGFAPLRPYEGDHLGENYNAFLDKERRLPLTHQLQDPLRGMVSELLVAGAARPPSLAGRPIEPGQDLTLELVRPNDGPLQFSAAFATGGTGGLEVRITGPMGPVEFRLPPGGACNVLLAPGQRGEQVPVRIAAGPAGPVTLASVCLTRFEIEASIQVERRLGWANAQLHGRQSSVDPQVEYMRNSLSWRVTRPLRGGRSVAAKVKRRLAAR